ncbi:MAG: tRNA (adenosine(37)-N6)-dimethylallyltransferase MiaA [Ruminococcus sp.]|nr:tRNA (adenosine(37)-N6)-dimethylallyltransferase MiaA [Ruminococcus sp.]
MTNNGKIKLLVVVGPTASGKTSLAIELAKKYNGEVISADSMQIYKQMRIATAKPSVEEMDGVRHHMLDFLEPDKSYSVGQYVLDAQRAIEDIVSREKNAIICGGTGLYIDSLLKGIEFEDSSSDRALREELNLKADEKGLDHLLGILADFDPDSAERLSKEKNKKRIIRAIEFYKTTGKTITQQNEADKQEKYDSLIFGLTAKDRQYIYDRINLRVDIMIESGLLEEAKSVLNSDLSETSRMAIGYKQLKPYFDNEKTLEECIERLKTETRHYAKRQLTWFRRNNNIEWINIDEYKNSKEQLEYASGIIKNRGFYG